jgi:hypothetical protein
MTGYDKSPDQGGPRVTRWTLPILIAAFVAVWCFGYFGRCPESDVVEQHGADRRSDTRAAA